MQNRMRFAARQQRCARAGVDSLFGERAGAPGNKRMRRRGRHRYTSRRHCSGAVPAVGALLASVPVLNGYGLAGIMRKLLTTAGAAPRQMKEKAARREAVPATSPFGDPAPESLNSPVPSVNHLPWGRVAKPPL
jgi:hypothetical protein